MKALLVEDDPLVREMLSYSLEDCGFEVTAVADGAAAFACGDAEYDGFELLVTDIRLGPGPDGWSVADRLKDRFRRLAVVYITGADGRDWKGRAVRGSAMLTKPFDAGSLQAAAQSCLAA